MNVILERAAFASIAIAALAACHHRPKKYEATVQLERMRVVRKNEAGKPLTLDVELSYFECPGDQDEVIRGGEGFAACMTKHKIGDKLKVKIEHRWSPEGHYRWDVLQVGDCERTIDPADEASYAMIRECEDWKANGVAVGFQCNVSPQKTLVKKCPWFAKH